MRKVLVAIALLAGMLAMGLAASGQRVIQVGPSGDHTKIQAAITSLGNSITEPVVIEIADGDYNEQIIIPDIAGTSATNTITLRRKSSGTGAVKITTTALVPQVTHQLKGIFTNDGADYVTVEGLHFFTDFIDHRTPKALVVIRGESNHNTFRNCTFSSKERQAGLKEGLYNLHSYRPLSGNLKTKVNQHLTVEGCTFIGGYCGVDLTSGIVSQPSEGNRVINCTFKDQTGFAVFGNLLHDMEVVGNTATFTKAASSTKKDLPFFAAGNVGKCLIAQNVVRMNAPARCQGIEIRSKASSHQDEPVRIENNSIYITNQGREQTAGIAIAGKDCNNVKVRYNTVFIDGTAPTDEDAPCCVYVYGKSTGVEFANNLLQNQCDKGVVYSIQMVDVPIASEQFSFSHNGAFSASQFALVGKKQPAKEATAQEWMSADVAGESTLVNVKALFEDANRDLKLKEGAEFQKAKPLTDVTKDIEGTTRSTSVPTIGAYEMPLALQKIEPQADGVRVNLYGAKKAEVHYLVLPESAPAPQDADYKDDQKLILEAGANQDITVSGLAAGSRYVVYVRVKPEGGTPFTLKASFETKQAQTSITPAKFNGLNDGQQSPFEDGSFTFDGFEVTASTFPGDAFGVASKSAKLTGATGTVKIKDGAKATLPGFYVFLNKPKVEVELLNAAATKFEVSVPVSGWIYIPLADRGEVEGFKITGVADGITLIDNVGAPHTVKPRIYMTTPSLVAVGGSITLSAHVSGVQHPYTLQWKSPAGEALGTAIEQMVTVNEKSTYTLEVSDATGSKAGHVTVQPGDKLAVATFEDLGLGENTHWKGDKNDVLNQFVTGSFVLPNWSSQVAGWADFGYSSETSTEFHDYNDDMRSVVGHGAQGSKTWGVLYNSSFAPSSATLALQVAPDGAELPGIWLTNNAYAYSSMTKGDSFVGDPIKEGDWMKVIIKGDDGRTVDYYLGDYRTETPEADRYVLDRWAWVDLSSLGKVKTISISVVGSRTNAYGQLYPSYVCVDDIGSTRPEKVAAKVIASSADPVSVELASLADMPQGLLHAEKEGDWTWANGATVSIEDGKFVVKGWDGQTEGEKEFVVKLYAKGVIQWVRIPVALQKQTLYTFAGITVEGNGTAAAKLNGADLAKDAKVNATDEIEVTYTPAAGFKPAEPEAVTATGATSVGNGKWKATADNFAFTVKFVPIPSTKPTLASIDVEGHGSVKVLNAAGEALKLGDELEVGALLTVTATPDEGWALKSLGVVGADQDGDKWKVTASVNIKAMFVEAPKPPAPTVTLVKVEKKGEGTLEITDPNGKALSQGEKLPKGSQLRIKATPAGGYELKDENFRVFGATKNGDLWTATSDVIISVNFTKIGASDPTPVEEHPLAGARAYPNPVEQLLNVDGVQPATSYALFNMLGTVVRSGQAGGDAFTLDMGALPAGIYILRLRNADGREVALRIVRR